MDNVRALSSAPIQSIVIVGGGAVAWTSALVLATDLRPYGIEISLVEPLEAPPEPALEMSQPALRELLKICGLDERALLAQCAGSMSLGVQYRRSREESFFLPYGRHGISPNPASFEQGFFKACGAQPLSAFHQHFLATQAAQRGRFDFPVDDPRSAKSTLRYGLQLDRSAYTRYVRRRAEALGVRCVRGALTGVSRDPESGVISRLQLDGGAVVEGDFYIDASGSEAQLIGQALGVDYQSWSDCLPWNRYLSCTRSEPTQLQPYSQLISLSWGWCRQTGLQGRSVTEYFFSREHEAAARRELEGHEILQSVSPNPGRREHCWAQNCLALGDAASHPGALILSDLHWVGRALFLWLELYPHAREQESLRAEYNRRCAQMLESVRDFHGAHHALHHGAHGLEKPSHAAVAPDVPESLRWRLDLFAQQGRLWAGEDELITPQDWIALLLGLGVKPERYDIVLSDVPDEQLRQTHAKIHRALVQVSESMPPLEQVIERYCLARH